MEFYERLVGKIPQPVGADTAVAFLSKTLKGYWESEYPSTGGELLTVRQGGEKNNRPIGDTQLVDGKSKKTVSPLTLGAIDTIFDFHSAKGGTQGSDYDRVVAVWGLSRSEAASTRDTGRMGGFLKGVWSDAYPGRDRGHFFAHTMGGGTDINLFPQLASVNRGGEWRRMEIFAAEHPGTFCFIRPFYKGAGWTPYALEYGIFKMPPDGACTFWGQLFPN